MGLNLSSSVSERDMKPGLLSEHDMKPGLLLSDRSSHRDSPSTLTAADFEVSVRGPAKNWERLTLSLALSSYSPLEGPSAELARCI